MATAAAETCSDDAGSDESVGDSRAAAAKRRIFVQQEGMARNQERDGGLRRHHAHSCRAEGFEHNIFARAPRPRIFFLEAVSDTLNYSGHILSLLVSRTHKSDATIKNEPGTNAQTMRSNVFRKSESGECVGRPEKPRPGTRNYDEAVPGTTEA